MKIAILGRGNVATHLSRALRAAHHEVCLLGGRDFDDVLPNGVEVVILSVSDRSVADIDMTATMALVVHTSGSVAMDEIRARRRGVLYPMQTFSKEKEVDFAQVPFFVEAACNDDLRMLEELAGALSERVFKLDSEGRKRLHLAAVICCNFVNHLYDITDRMLHNYDIPFEVMLPLIQETTDKVMKMSPREAQTGPAVRGDVNVLEKHLEMMDDESLRELYRNMSERIYRYKD